MRIFLSFSENVHIIKSHAAIEQRNEGDEDMSTLPTRRQQIAFAPITGTSGYVLTGYSWQYELIGYVDSHGNDRVKRVSDWTSADVADITGREIVHQFSVTAPDGRDMLVSLEAAAKLLGFAKSDTGAKKIGSIASAVKTLAKLRMELASIEAQNASYAAKNAEHAADLAACGQEVATLRPEVTVLEPGVESWKMGGLEWIYRGYTAEHMQDYDRQARAARLSAMRDGVTDLKMLALGHTAGRYPAVISAGDLPERIRRQELKISKMN